MEVLSTGEKLKKIRKKYAISQKTLTQDIISITMLSYIENNKLMMSEKIATDLCNRLREVVGELVITPQELFYSEEAQAIKIIETIIKIFLITLLDNLKKLK